MSDQTREAVSDAIRAHLADEADGSFLTDWVLMAAGAVPESADRTRYLTEFSDSPMHSLTGLNELLRIELENQATGDGDDDA